MPEPIEYRWRWPVTDAEMVTLVRAHGGRATAGWWDQIRPHSLGWVTARLRPGGGLAESLAGFYFDACGFRPTPAGLMHLPTQAGLGTCGLTGRLSVDEAVRVRPGIVLPAEIVGQVGRPRYDGRGRSGQPGS